MSTIPKGERPAQRHPPPLQAGDHLTRAEFERRYAAMPHVKKAELIEGVVYVPSPVNNDAHGEPHSRVSCWIVTYVAFTPGVNAGADSTVRLDRSNEPQPDVHLRIVEKGQTRNVEGWIEGPPELIVEVSATSASYDLHSKLAAYRRNGVCEYIVWRTLDGAVDWFVLSDDEYKPLPPDPGGVLRSRVFPGLWLDPAALLRDDMARVLAVAEQGIASPEHAAFVAEMATRRSGE
jgi:Uma2 family endonuclease